MAQRDQSSGYGISLHVPCQPSSLALPCLGPSLFCPIVQCCMAPVQCLVPSGNAGWLEASVLEALARRLAPEAPALVAGGVPSCLEAAKAVARRVACSPRGIGARRPRLRSSLSRKARAFSRPCRLGMQAPCRYVGMILVG
jgi:hypothetical protein